MRKPETAAVMTFYTTSAAMRCEKLCRECSIPGRLFPAPRSMTADCGIAWRSPAGYREQLEALCCEQRLEYEQLSILSL